MKKLATAAAAVAFVLAAGAPAVAAGGGYGSQPGYEVANAHTTCAGHGAFGAFGTYGTVQHDFRGGANGQATGANNSGLCGNPQG